MSGSQVLVTGASGFIGRRLVRRLIERGNQVTCLVRKTSNTSELESLGARLHYGDIVGSSESLARAVQGHDTIYHLAANTKSLTTAQMISVNVDGVTNLLNACASINNPPTVVFVSSLAAVGPSSVARPHFESDTCNPVSHYGESKCQAELIARSFSASLPITIVRPPIVLGPGDEDGFTLFQSIARSGIHLVPGYKQHFVSVIHVDDLVTALILAAKSGTRLSAESQTDGLYFAAADETIAYSELGKMIAKALGREKVRILPSPLFMVWALAAINSVLGRLRGKPQLLNLDKAREATAGTWTCSNSKICSELGFAPAFPLAERLKQTVAWYGEHGWLPKRKIPKLDSTSAESSNRDMIYP